MKLLLLSYLLCFSIGYHSVIAVTDTEVSASTATIEAGGQVDITCKITEYKDELVTWYKRQGKEEVQLGTNAELSNIFETSGRYSIKRETVDANTNFVVTITGAVAEDSGEIGCEIKSANVPLKYAKVEILVAVSEIHLYGLDEGGHDVKEYKDGDTIEFHDGDKFYFRCQASGSNPTPTFDITLDGSSVLDKFDYAHSYRVTGGQPGLKTVTHNATSTTTSPVVISTAHNTKAFTCSASVPNTESKSITIKPTMSFTPKVRCEDNVIMLPVFSINTEVVCTVKSDPHAEDIYLFWKNIHGANFTLRDDDEYGHYRMIVSNGATTDEKKITFKVDRLGPQSFRTYTLYARNAMGTSSDTIEVKRDHSREASTGSTLSKVSIFVTLIVSYVCTLL